MRAPKSAQIAEPLAPASSSEVANGAPSRTIATTDAAPAKLCAPSCWVRLPICRATTAPSGIDTSAVGTMITRMMIQACRVISAVAKGRRGVHLTIWTRNRKKSPIVSTVPHARTLIVDMTLLGPGTSGPYPRVWCSRLNNTWATTEGAAAAIPRAAAYAGLIWSLMIASRSSNGRNADFIALIVNHRRSATE